MKALTRTAAAALCAVLCGCASSLPLPPSRLALAEPTGERHFLRGVECLDPRMARGWVDLGRGVLLVDAGRFKYRVELAHDCPAVGWTPQLLFRGDPIGGRVCGGGSDAILTRDYTCSIGDMRLLSDEQYRALLNDYDARRKRRPVAN